ncbi:hypothetical protein [Nocardia pseudobrasiliensis]|uniref:Uncharacterized protein n=1 Tax=Nocardia pseudobrasiliensis TaxID=45979 RepID=A0A370HUH5_9NOCA|nr:hypothetical protein [Nocardia pseudobrasiliensis]RDI61601.1 hypothetical protein DFR76_113102 [Nocardia pseudobrasiliensis]
MTGDPHSEEPQSARGEPGSRDTGSDTVAGGPADREPGDMGHEEHTSAQGTDPDREVDFTTEPGSAAEPAVPPYEGRKTSANESGETAGGEVGGAEVGGATAPSDDEG